MVTTTILHSLENHPIIKVLLSLLPQEIVVLIAFKFKGITPYSTYISQIELLKKEEMWFRQFIQRTIISIYVYRKNNDFSKNPFFFPRIDPPNVNKTSKICDVRHINLKYQLYSKNIPISPYNIQFVNMNRKILMYLFTNLVDDNYHFMNRKEIKIEKLVRIYYRFDIQDSLQFDNLDEYLESISYTFDQSL